MITLYIPLVRSRARRRSADSILVTPRDGGSSLADGQLGYILGLGNVLLLRELEGQRKVFPKSSQGRYGVGTKMHFNGGVVNLNHSLCRPYFVILIE